MKNTPALSDADINEIDMLLAAVPERLRILNRQRVARRRQAQG